MVKAQSSVEFMLILAGVMALSALALGGAVMHLNATGEFAQNATGLLGNSTASFLSNLSSGGSFPYTPPESGSDGAYPELGLEIYAPALYVGVPSVVQAVIWNYGGASAEVALLEMTSSDSSGLSLSPTSQSGLSVGISHVMSSVAVPNAEGAYVVSAVAFGEDGQPLRSSDGNLLSKNATVFVLSGYGGGIPGKPSLPYAISFSGLVGEIEYEMTQPYEVQKGVSMSVHPPIAGMEGNWRCPCDGSRAWFSYMDYSSGDADLKCVCIRYSNSANISMIGTAPRFMFSAVANVSNATGSEYICGLGDALPECVFDAGNASFAGNASGTGAHPASDSVAVAVAGNSTWSLRSLSAYNAHKSAFISLDAALSTVNGYPYCISINCNGIRDQILAVEGLRASFLASTPSSASGCVANPPSVECNATSFQYPKAVFRLNSSFLGGNIPEMSPDRFTASGIDVEVSSFR